VSLLIDFEKRPSLNPLWWRLPVWGALLGYSIARTSNNTHAIAGGIVMGVGVVTLQWINAEDIRARRAIILVATVTGLAAILLMPSGFAEVLLIVATSRSPRAFGARPLLWFVILDSIAFGTTIAVISGPNLSGALAGLAIPFLVQREVDHQALISERDRAQALLVEVQNGREAEAQAAALQERGRIAREMHDVLAHSLAGLSVQLQALRTMAARDGVAPPVLTQLDKAATLAREGLAEARSAVSTLRDPVGLGLDALPALVARHPGDARLAVDGRPGTVEPGAGHAVYRAVQESLTNAARYAPGAGVTITLGWSADTLTAIVRDTGPGPGRTAGGGQGTGLGLAGMDERLRSIGGSVHAGPHEGGGWQVELTVPAEPAADPLEPRLTVHKDAP
jgi:signal transduction histidine kinase